jgi:hypothetical protein
MPVLDSCIAGIFVPGNIGADSGTPAVVPTFPTVLDPDDYDPDSVTYSWDHTKFYNSFYLGAY